MFAFRCSDGYGPASEDIFSDWKIMLQRVDDVDEVFVNTVEQPIKQSRGESYDAQIIPRYKEAVLVAWDAFEGFRTSKTSLQSSNVKPRTPSQVPFISHGFPFE
jgi:hypothetical protein